MEGDTERKKYTPGFIHTAGATTMARTVFPAAADLAVGLIWIRLECNATITGGGGVLVVGHRIPLEVAD